MSLRAQLRTRDAFLLQATAVLARSAKELERALHAQSRMSTRVREATGALQTLVRELRVIADPDAPVPLCRVELELASTLAELLHQRRARMSLKIERSGALFCRADSAHTGGKRAACAGS